MRYLVFISAIILIFSSCSDNSKSDNRAYKITEEALSLSTSRMNQHTTFEYKSLEAKVEDPHTHYQAIFWQPKAVQIKKLTSEVINYIEILKNDLKKEAGLKTNGNEESYNGDNRRAVLELFDERSKGNELFKKLELYKKDMLGIDEKMKTALQHYIVLTTNSFNSSDQSSENFVSYFFKGITVDAALSMLGVFESNVRIMENDFVTYCKAQIGNTFDGYDVFRAIIGQSSNCVKTGDYIILTAGVGSFSMAVQPQFIMDGKIIEANADAVAEYKFKAPSKAGKYSKVVKIEYTKPDGTKESMTKNIEYTVIEPNQTPQ